MSAVPWWVPVESQLRARSGPTADLPDVPPVRTRRDAVVLARLLWASHGIGTGAPLSGPSEIQALVARFTSRAGADPLPLLIGLRERIEADRPPFVVGWESWIRMVGSTVRASVGVEPFQALRLAFAEEWASADLTPAEAVAARYLTAGPQLVPAQVIALSGTMAWDELLEAHDHLLQDTWVRARLLAGAGSGHPWVDGDRLRDAAGPGLGRVAAAAAAVPGEAWWRTAERTAAATGDDKGLPAPGTWRDRVLVARIRWLAAGAAERVRDPEGATERILRSVRADGPRARLAVLVGLREVVDGWRPAAGAWIGAVAEALVAGLERDPEGEGIRAAFREELISAGRGAAEEGIAGIAAG